MQDWIFKVGYSILATYLGLDIQSRIFHPGYIFRAGYSKDWIFKVGYSILATYLGLDIQSRIFHPGYIFRTGYSK
jgi:hypothetical protein